MGYARIRADRPPLPGADRVTGFEPLDLLEGVLRTVRQLEAGRAEVENQYARAVRPEGNPASRRLIEDVFEVCDRKWRGVGLIPESGYQAPRTSTATTTPSGSSRSTTSRRRNRRCASAGRSSRAEEAARLPGVRQGMHAADAAGRHDGLGRRRLCRLLRLRPASRVERVPGGQAVQSADRSGPARGMSQQRGGRDSDDRSDGASAAGARHVPAAAVAVRPHPARPRQRRPADAPT